jgi:hypothetical protein
MCEMSLYHYGLIETQLMQVSSAASSLRRQVSLVFLKKVGF